MRALKHIFSVFACLVALATTSCAVHEWPDPNPFNVDVTLNLDYKTEMPLYDIVEQTSRWDKENTDYDIRYTVEFYEMSKEGKFVEDAPDIRKVFVKDHFETSDDFKHTVQLTVPARNYIIYVWTDIIPHGDVPVNLFYNAERFGRVELIMENYVGNTVLRDAFTGHTTLDLSGYLHSGMSAEATIESERPMAKVQFITTDVEEFISKYLAMKEKEVGHKMDADDYTRLLDLQQFTVKVKYSWNMPSSFSMYEDKPNNSVEAPSFETKITPIDKNEASLAFEYVLVNGKSGDQQFDIEVYDADERMLSRVRYIPVKILRSHLTIVRSKFLTADIQGGAVIDPGFAPDDDNFIYWIE